MYLPTHFAEERVEVLHAALREYPFATLVTQGATGIEANHLPLLLHVEAGQTWLRGHVARANRLWREHPSEVEVLAIFHGPQAYITPNWYPGKHDHGKAVPTWNYLAVHARGTLRVIDDKDWLRTLLEDLTAVHEAGSARPWRVADAPAEYIAQMMGAVVGIEIAVTALQGKFKCSQNQPAANRAGTAAGLRHRNGQHDAEMADWVERSGKDGDAR